MGKEDEEFSHATTLTTRLGFTRLQSTWNFSNLEFATNTHLLGLHSVRAAIDSQTLEIGVVAVRMAIEKSIKGANQSIRTSYDLAMRSARKDNLFADVLLSCALADASDLGYFAAQDVRKPMGIITGKQYEIPSFAKHLTEFCDDKRGPILQKSGSRRLHRYRFVNL
jgi:hypothetical protein